MSISQESAAALSTRNLSIRPPPRSASVSGDGDPVDLPPAYSVFDMARSPLQLSEVNCDGGDEIICWAFSFSFLIR